MSQGQLCVTNLGKAFRRYGSEWRRVLSWFGVPISPLAEYWALRHVSFMVEPGEAVGIVGQNGAGKSTLLKIITGTLKPNEGNVQVNGRVAAILELGMGFAPELTGRQNVYHSAGLMGFSRSAIDRVMSDIELFAEVGKYFDQPVRTYSSGMQMRVAFSVATAFRPDVLIVDEALSVGDTYFQHKSFGRIREFREKGTTLLIVSHDTQAILSICDRAIMLEAGAIVKEGLPTDVIDFYNAMIAEKEKTTVSQSITEDGRIRTTSGTGEARVEDIAILDEAGKKMEFVSVGEPVCLKITARIFSDIPRLVLGIMIKDRVGQVVYGTNTYHTDQILENVRAGETVTYCFEFIMTLGPGSYSISTAFVSTDTHLVNNYEWRDLALSFNVVNTEYDYFIGTTWLKPEIRIEAKK